MIQTISKGDTHVRLLDNFNFNLQKETNDDTNKQEES